MQTVPLEKSTLGVEVIPGVEESHAEFPAKSLQAAIKTESFVVELVRSLQPWKNS